MCSFQFETEIEGGKLRRDVLAEGSMGSGAAPAGISSLLSGQEETFAFRRAVCNVILVHSLFHLYFWSCTISAALKNAETFSHLFMIKPALMMGLLR